MVVWVAIPTIPRLLATERYDQFRTHTPYEIDLTNSGGAKIKIHIWQTNYYYFVKTICDATRSNNSIIFEIEG